jgi:selenium metabolism protein YedF
MRLTVDARGMSCPDPVIMTRKALEQQDVDEVLTIVDNETALENISTLVKTMQMGSMVEEQEGSFYINIMKEDIAPHKERLGGNTVILLKSNVLGQGDDTLGSALMKSFIYTLTQLESEIKSLIFLNGGVLLATAGSDLILHIKRLENNGVEILSSATCLDFYGLTNRLLVGKVVNMLVIVEELLRADKVIVI